MTEEFNSLLGNFNSSMISLDLLILTVLRQRLAGCFHCRVLFVSIIYRHFVVVLADSFAIFSIFNKYKTNPYDHNKKSDEFSTQPLRDGVGLYDIRQRLQEIIYNCNPEDVAIAKKQTIRLYKLVDAMINQGKSVD